MRSSADIDIVQTPVQQLFTELLRDRAYAA